MSFAEIATNDFQGRGDRYPKAGIPVTIDDNGDHAVFSFKNTSELIATKWVKSFLYQKGIEFTKLESWQDGDYHDDWVNVQAK